MSSKDCDVSYQSESKHSSSDIADSKDSKNSDSKSDSKQSYNTVDLDAFQEYFFGNDDFTLIFENFINSNCHIVDLESEEYKLEYTTVFNNYKELFETKMEEFIVTKMNCSINDFYYTLKNKMEDDPDGSVAFFGMLLIAVTDFDVFMTMMREGAQQLKDDHK